ncbi:hypothetical protein [Blastococcus sp. SYSU DS1021]
MTTTEASPTPDASRFRRKIDRPKRAPSYESKWTTVEDWSTPTVDEYEAMPDGTRLAFTAGDSLHLTALRRGPRWTVLARTQVPSRALAGLATAPRVRVGDVEEPEAGA